MLERGSVASLLASFYMAPTRCPHCGHGLSDTLGLEVLAAACGTRSIDELVELMVRSLSEGASVTYQRTLADHVALLAPPTTFARACTFVGNIPSALMYIPQRYFILFLDETNFVSESQAYALAVQYITTGARFELSEENIECVLDSVRFLWLNVGLVESEIERLELGLSAAIGSPKGLLVPKALLARLTQTLRFKSMVMHVASGQPERCVKDPPPLSSLPPVLQDQDHPIVKELQRYRRSYGFLPRTVRDQPPQAMTTPTLVLLQPLCV